MRICVYCSSSDRVDRAYVEAAHSLAYAMATRGHELIYGGASVGLMGQVARAMSARGGRVMGIIPRNFSQRELMYTDADELIITDSIVERKGLMIRHADAFMALPGGFGTLEEISEVLTLKQLGDLTQPIVLFNTNGFYEPLLSFFERMFTDAFARPEYRHLYHITADAGDALRYIEGYTATPFPLKWFPRDS
jgi:cytokinin riboside 5'-monophosphate phosphoribohydrolase